MSDKFLVSPPGGVALGPGERLLWSGNCAVAEYAFEQPASLPRWTLPEETEIAVTDERVIYRDPATMETGELRWVWPQHIRVQPGNRDRGRSATATQIQLVCAGPAETYPALVLAGGDLATVGDADRLANLLRQTIGRFRVEHANELGLSAAEARMLSRVVIGPEFNNYQGGEGQTVSLLGAVAIHEPGPSAHAKPALAAHAEPIPSAYAEPIPSAYAEPIPSAYAEAVSPAYAEPLSYARAEPVPTGYPAPVPSGYPAQVPSGYPEAVPSGHPEAVPSIYPEPVASVYPEPVASVYPEPVASVYPEPVASDYPKPVVSIRETPDEAGQRTVALRWNSPGVPRQHHPDPVELASRAADLAARVAMLVSEANDLEWETRTANLSSHATPSEPPAEASISRAEAARRTAARMAGNSPRRSVLGQRQPDEAPADRPRG